MAIMDGLATYEIIKTGFTIFIMCLFLCCAVGLTINNLSKNYISTKNCNITSNVDKSQILTYTVDKQYTQQINPTITTNNNVSTKNYAYQNGPCTLYYPSANPSVYSVNSNPTTVSEIIAGILCCLTILTFLWFLFLRSHRGVAGVVGGIDVANTAFRILR
jgi:ATP-dependent Zn protease